MSSEDHLTCSSLQYDLCSVFCQGGPSPRCRVTPVLIQDIYLHLYDKWLCTYICVIWSNSHLWGPGIVFMYLETLQLRLLSVGRKWLYGLVLEAYCPLFLQWLEDDKERVVGMGSWTCAPVACTHSLVTTFSTLDLLNIMLLHYHLHSVNCFLLNCTVWGILITCALRRSLPSSKHRAFSSPSRVPSSLLDIPLSPNPGLRKPLMFGLFLVFGCYE